MLASQSVPIPIIIIVTINSYNVLLVKHRMAENFDRGNFDG